MAIPTILTEDFDVESSDSVGVLPRYQHDSAQSIGIPPYPPHHHPCLPPPGSCPDPDHPDDGTTIPIVIITEATPITSPPEYETPSPPKYAAIPSSAREQTLLLAPPPSFADATRCRRCDLEAADHQHTCETTTAPDWVTRLLILLNVIVWSAVFWGYYLEWADPQSDLCGAWGIGPASSTFGGMWPSCVDRPVYGSYPGAEMGIGRNCVEGECSWTSVAC
ncbi:MAG: hypothetical protein TREMPRED_002341 [Tremellales sp. Tagirdzhanova-0007]|nr:MAG: hypothetical protein TREMPRED_002341 [Tremellales sp. Tagirdzhanova-0007]